MTTFVALALLMTLAAVGVVWLGVRAPRTGDRWSRRRMNVAVARQQLRELVRERDLGVIAQPQFEAMRDELQRRLLADAQPGEPPEATRALRWPLIAIAAAVPVLAATTYGIVGTPGAIGRAGDGSTAPLEAQVAAWPNDARAWVLLARSRMDAEQFAPAATAYARAIALSPKVANDPQVWAEYADALGMTQGGALAGKPREAIDRALRLDPRQPKALELAGSAAYEARDFRAAHAHWRALLEALPPDSPQRLPLAAAVEKVERLTQWSWSSARVN